MAITTQDKVAGLYAAFFNRAPDKAGFDQWVTKLDAGTSTLNDIAAGFADTNTFKTTYDSLSNEDFVKAVYVNMLGHAGDATGIANQVKALDDGTYATKADFVAGFVDSALTVDLNDAAFADLSAADKTAAQDRQDQLINKTTVSQDFMAKLGDATNVTDAANPDNDPAYLASIKVLSGVTADKATVTTATDAIAKLAATPDTAIATLNAMPTVTADATVIADAQATAAAAAATAAAAAADAATGVIGEVKLMSTGMDNTTGTANDDIFYGVIDGDTATNNTFSSFDTLNGEAGYDTFNVSMTGDNYTGSANLSNIEQFNLKTTSAQFFDVSGLSDVKEIENDKSTDALTIKGIDSADTTLALNKLSNSAANTTFNFADTALAGSDDTVNLKITGGVGTTAATATQYVTTIQTAAGTSGAENVTVNVTGAAANLGALTVQDNSTAAAATTMNKLTITGDSDFRVVTTLDFAGATGTVDASASTGKVNLGFGAEANTITGGSSDDTFVFAANLDANDTVDGGTGTDTVSVTSATMNGFTATPLTDANGNATVKNVEAVTISDSADSIYTATDVDAGVDTVTYAADSTGSTLNFATGSNTLNLKGTLSGTQTITVSGAAADDKLDVVMAATTTNAGSQTIATTGVEELTITNDKASTTLGDITTSASSGGSTTVKFVGSQNATLAATKTITATTVDASGLTGTAALTMTTASGITTLTGSANADTLLTNVKSTINGGAGNDTITATGTTDDTLNGGDGKDTITTAAGKDTVDAGAGDDTVIMAANLDYDDVKIDGGAGTDKLSITAAQANTIGGYSTANKATMDAAVTNFETLKLDSLSGQTAIDMSDLWNLNTIELGKNGTGATDAITANSTISKVVDATTVVYNHKATVATDKLTLTMADATGSADSLSFKLADSVSADFGQVAAAGVETINVNSTKTATGTSTINTLDFTDAAAGGLQTLNITGNVGFTSDLGSSTLTTVDASGSTVTGVNGMTINATATTKATTFTGSSAKDTFYAGSAADTLNGGGGDDRLYGFSGNDTINGGVGADTIDGGAGNDTINGGAGDDIILTSGGTDTIDGGDGNDTLKISSSAYADISGITTSNLETLDMQGHATTMTIAQFGGFTTVSNAAAATLTDAGTVNLGTNITTVTLANGTNTVTASTTAANYTLTGGTGNDTFNFGSDTITSGDTINGTSGTDVLNITGNTAVTSTALNTISNIDTVNFANTSTAVAWTSAGTGFVATGDSMKVDASSLTTAAASLDFSANTTTGAVTLIGGNTGDTLTGGAGADVILGNAGNDVIDGTTGVDTLTGGLGNDVFVVDSGALTTANKDVVTDFSHADDSIRINDALTNGGTGVITDGLVTGEYQTAAAAGSYTVGANEVAIEFNFEFDHDIDLTSATKADILSALGAVDDSTASSVTAGTLTMTAAGDEAIAIFYQNGDAYMYRVTSGADADITTADADDLVTLVGTYDNVAVGAFDYTDFIA